MPQDAEARHETIQWLMFQIGRVWIMGDAYTIGDIATFPWVRNLIGFCVAGELVGIQRFPNVSRVLGAFLARPAVARGLPIHRVPTSDEKAKP